MSLINRSTRLLLAVCAISFIVAPSRAFGQATTGTVTGVVSDSSGTPVAGARVSVDGLNLATSSGQTGRYTLSNVPAGTQTVRARLLGYRLNQVQTTVIAGQTATVNLRLNIAPAELERVIVSTGYGQQTKANVTGASEVVAGEEITKRPVANITKGLQGKFSVYHGAAIGLVRGKAGLDEYTDAAVNDAAVRQVRERATAVGDSSLTEDQAHVEVELTDGRRLTSSIEQSLGNVHRPLSDDQLSEKFRMCAVRALPSDVANTVLDRCWRIAELDDVATLVDATVPLAQRA